MKYFSQIFLISSAFLLTACEEYMTQPAAQVEYRLEDYYGYGDVQGPPAAASKEAIAMQNKGVPVVIEDVSSDQQTVSNEIVSEDIAPPAEGTQVYTISDNVGPKTPEGYIIRPQINSEAQSVEVSNKTHVVQKGETLFSLSRQFDIPILPIIVINGLEPPYALNEGQQIKIPEGKFHTVREGETLYSISRQYGVDMSGIVKLNELQMPYNVVKGQRLQVPFPTDLPAEDKEALVETTVDPEPMQTHTQASSSPDDASYKPASLRRPSGGTLGAYNQPTQTATIDTEKENEQLAQSTTQAIQNIDVKDDGKFMWPVQGKVVKKFGQQGAEYNDGINIAASSGTQVKASNSGRVVYTGNSLKSYGNLVIIKHDNGLLTAYAHLNNVNVKKDQKISKGQAIGTVGSTGKVTSPQLYFAVRKGKDAKNPMNYLN